MKYIISIIIALSLCGVANSTLVRPQRNIQGSITNPWSENQNTGGYDITGGGSYDGDVSGATGVPTGAMPNPATADLDMANYSINSADNIQNANSTAITTTAFMMSTPVYVTHTYMGVTPTRGNNIYVDHWYSSGARTTHLTYITATVLNQMTGTASFSVTGYGAITNCWCPGGTDTVILNGTWIGNSCVEFGSWDGASSAPSIVTIQGPTTTYRTTGISGDCRAR